MFQKTLQLDFSDKVIVKLHLSAGSGPLTVTGEVIEEIAYTFQYSNIFESTGDNTTMENTDYLEHDDTSYEELDEENKLSQSGSLQHETPALPRRQVLTEVSDQGISPNSQDFLRQCHRTLTCGDR